MTLTDVWTVAIGFGTLVLTIVIIGLMIKSSNDTAHTRIEGNINKVEKNVNDNFNRVNDNFNRLFLELGKVIGKQASLGRTTDDGRPSGSAQDRP